MHFLCTDKHTHVRTHWPGCTHTDTETRYRYVSGSVAGSVSELRGKTLPLRTTHFVKLNCELRFTISRKATGPGTHTHRRIHTCMRYACTQIHAHKRSRQTSRKIVAVSPKQNSNRATTHKMSVELCVYVCECDSNSHASVCVSVENNFESSVVSSKRNTRPRICQILYVAISQGEGEQRQRERATAGREHVRCSLSLSSLLPLPLFFPLPPSSSAYLACRALQFICDLR